MNIPYSKTAAAIAAGCCFSTLTSMGALSFSVDAASGFPGFPDDILAPGPALVTPGSFGVPGLPPIEVNAFSSFQVGRPGSEFQFTVGRGSLGAPFSAVNGESTGPTLVAPFFGDEPADIFRTSLTGTNTQVWDEDGAVIFPATPGAPSPALGLAPVGIDNVDAIDETLPPLGFAPGVLFSVDFPSAIGLGVSPSDILIAPAVPGYSTLAGAPFLPGVAFGLTPADDLDALIYYDDGDSAASPADSIVFSLAAGSPTLGLLGASPADILISSPFGGLPAIYAPAGALGLLPTDELDGLAIPEPSAIAGLFGIASLLLARRRTA